MVKAHLSIDLNRKLTTWSCIYTNTLYNLYTASCNSGC